MGGFFFEFEPFRTASGPLRRVRETAVASMASSRPRRRDGVAATPHRSDALDATLSVDAGASTSSPSS